MNKFIQNFLLVIFSSLIILLLLEIFLYIDHFSPNYKRYEMKLNNVKLSFNDNPKSFFNDTNPNKIVFLGDSFTVGEVCAHNKKDFVNLLKKSDKNISSIYNFGSLGISPTDMINIYNYLKNGEFNRLVVVLYYNDIFLSKQSCKNILKFDKFGIPFVEKCNKVLKEKKDRSEDTIIKKIDNYLEIRLKIWKLLKESLANTPYFSKFYNRSDWKTLYRNKNSEEFQLLLNTLKYFKKESEAKKFKIEYIYFPDVNHLITDNIQHKDWINFINESKNHNIKIYDPWNYFLNSAEKKDLTWSLTDKHPNCEAHEIMFSYIEKNLL